MRKLSLWMRAHPAVGDGVAAVLLLLLDGFIYAATQFSPRAPEMPPWYVTIPVDIAMVAPLVIRRKYPLVSGYLILAIGAAHSLLELGLTSLITGIIAVYTLVVYTTRRHAAVFVAILAVGSGAQLFFMYREQFLLQLLAVAVLTVLPWVLGEFVAARRAYQRELEARLTLLETEQDHAAMMAVAQERSRIARELHDVVAHSVSVIVVQADGASYALRESPEVAERAVRTISETGRSALAELRRLLDVLRNEDVAGGPRVPQPDAEELAELVNRVRAAGLAVRLELDDLDALPAGVSLGVYRIVQESLTNTIKHAGDGARAVVTVRRDDDGVRVEVSDDGAGKARRLRPAGNAQAHGGNGGDRNARARARLWRNPRSGAGPRWRLARTRRAAREADVISVMLVDDQELMRVGFRMVLDAQPDIEVVGEAGDGSEAVGLAERLRPDVVLMDVRMPVLDGVAATRRIVAAESSRVLVMTTFDLDEYVYSALRGGASGFLLKDTPPDHLVSALRSVAAGDSVVSPAVTRRLLDRFLGDGAEPPRDASVLDVLTGREREVLALVAKGQSNTEIAAGLFLSEATVKTHVGRILSKLDLRDRVQAVVLAYETGLIRPGA